MGGFFFQETEKVLLPPPGEKNSCVKVGLGKGGGLQQMFSILSGLAVRRGEGWRLEWR